jgi:hypothetical protein
VPYAYYRRLTRRQQATYRASDAIAEVPLPGAGELTDLCAAIAAALVADEPRRVQRASAALAGELCRRLGAPPVAVRVLAARPSGDYGELHGLYDPAFSPPRITLWMRTAARRQVVAFKSFLRTLLHELLHHLDYEVFGFEETFHTEGFFKRESSLARQLLGEPPPQPPG